MFGRVEGPLPALLVPRRSSRVRAQPGAPGGRTCSTRGSGRWCASPLYSPATWSCRAARLGRAWRASVGRGGLFELVVAIATANSTNRFTTGSGPRSADPSRRRRSKVPALPSRCGAGAQPRTLVIRQIRETLLAARLQGGSSMAGARPHRRRRAAASEGVQLLGGAARAKHRACPDVAWTQIPPTPRRRCSLDDVGRWRVAPRSLADCAVQNASRVPCDTVASARQE